MSTDDYYIDLNEFSITKLRDLLKNVRLLPSQQILRENIDERFACLEENGDVLELTKLTDMARLKWVGPSLHNY